MIGCTRGKYTGQACLEKQWRALQLPQWLSDAAKKFLGRPDRRPRPILDLPGVRIMAGSPEYLLAMKVLADRHDRDRGDLKFLIRLLGLKSVRQTERLFSEVYPMRRFRTIREPDSLNS